MLNNPVRDPAWYREADKMNPLHNQNWTGFGRENHPT
jgi:hypothetical protein